MNNKFNKVFSSFSSFHCESLPGNRLIDIFPNHFSFHSLNRKSNDNIKSHLCKLNSIILQVLSDLHLVVVLDTSIKNYVTTSISHVHLHDSPVIKTIHYTVNILSTEAKLFAIIYGINQATYLSNINYIFVRCGSHQSESPQNGLRDEQTCGMTLASAYVLCHLSATWSQLQMMGRSPRWK